MRKELLELYQTEILPNKAYYIMMGLTWLLGVGFGHAIWGA